jgi:transposase
MRSKATAVAKSIVRSRDVLVRGRTQLVNHVRAMVKQDGDRMPKCSSPSFHKLADALPAALRSTLEPILKVIGELTARIRAYDREIERMCTDEYPETLTLRQVSGKRVEVDFSPAAR